MANVTIGPVLEVGGNSVQMTTKGKFQVTDSKGKIKTLSQDEFKKNMIKNADKINNGEDFEFKKSHKTLKKLLVGALATTAIASTVIYRKQIAKYFKEFSVDKLKQDSSDLFETIKTKSKEMLDKVFNRKRVPKEQIPEPKN